MNSEEIDFLKTHGYVVVPNVLSSTEIEFATSSFHTWRTSVHNLDVQHVQIHQHGAYKYHQVGHQYHAWYIRTNPNVIRAFQTLWKTTELVTSFDGTCYIPETWHKRDTIWTHTDQAPIVKGNVCYQGFVSLTSNKERTFVVYDGSHIQHEEYFHTRSNSSKVNWQKIDKTWLHEHYDKKRVLHVNAGDLVIWDSRTFHQNQYGRVPEERIVQYVCFLPKQSPKNTVKMQKKRLEYFQERRTTSHWPYPIRVNTKQPNTYGNKTRYIDYTTLPEIDLGNLEPKIQMLL